MSGDSPVNSRAQSEFWGLFEHHWHRGTGLSQAKREEKGGWTEQLFIEAVKKAALPAPDKNTVPEWLKHQQWPQERSLKKIFSAFFNGNTNLPELQAMQTAWDEAQRTPPARRKSVPPPEQDPPKWVRSDESITEGLAELALAEPQPHSNEEGVFRIEGDPLVLVAEPEIDGRSFRVEVTGAALLFESDSYAIRPGSKISERTGDKAMKTVVGGVEFFPAQGEACLDGPLLDGDYFAIIEGKNTGDGNIHLTLRTVRGTRRSFRISKLDEHGRRISEDITDEQDAVLNILLGPSKDKDTLGRVELAKVTMRRIVE